MMIFMKNSHIGMMQSTNTSIVLIMKNSLPSHIQTTFMITPSVLDSLVNDPNYFMPKTEEIE